MIEIQNPVICFSKATLVKARGLDRFFGNLDLHGSTREFTSPKHLQHLVAESRIVDIHEKEYCGVIMTR